MKKFFFTFALFLMACSSPITQPTTLCVPKIQVTPEVNKSLSMNEIYQMQLKVECDTGKARNWIVKNIQNGTYESTFIDKNGMFTASQAGCFDVYATLGFDAVSNTVRLDVAKICSSISAPTPNSSKPIYISNVKCSDFSRWNYAQAYYIA